MDPDAAGDDGVTARAGALDTLRAASSDVDALGHGGHGGHDAFDPTEHATRFEAVHDALVAVLAEIDTTADPDRG